MQNTLSLRKITLLAGTGVAVLVFVIFLFTHSVLVIEGVSGEKQNNTTITLTKRGSSSQNRVKFGTSILASGEYDVTVVKGTSITKRDVKISLFRIARVNGDTIPQKESKKIARGTSECVFGKESDILNGVIYSYDCSSPQSIFVNTQGEHSIKNLLVDNLGSALTQTIPYQNGLLALSSGEEGNSMAFIEGSGVKNYPLGSTTLQNKSPSGLLLTADKSKIYLLDVVGKVIYEFTKPGEAPISHPLENKNQFKDSNVSFRVLDNNFYVVTARSDKESTDSFEQGELSVYENGSKNPTKIIKLGNEAGALFGFELLSKDVLVGRSLDQKTTVYTLKNDTLSQEFNISNTKRFTVVNGRLYILIDGDIYQYNSKSKTLNLEFGSAKTTVTALQGLGNFLIFSGVSDTDSSATNNTYALSTDPLTANYRLEDQLPYGDVELPVAWSDYFGNKIYVALSLDSLRKNPANGQYIFDQNEFNSKKAIVEQKLQKDGFSKDKYSIAINPY